MKERSPGRAVLPGRSRALPAARPATRRPGPTSPPEDEAQKFAVLFRSMRQGVFYQGPDGKLLDINPAARKMFGLSRREFLARTSTSSRWRVIRENGSLVPAEDLPSNLAFRSGRPVKDALLGVIHPKTGKPVWLIINAIPERRPGSKKPFRVAVTLHDITKRREAEKALQESRAKYEGLFENIRDAVSIYEAVDGGRDFVFRAINASAERIEKTTRERVLGRRLTEVFPPIRELGILEHFRQAWLTGKPVHFEMQFRRPGIDGEIWRENWIYKLPEGDIVVVFRDISQRKRIEDALRENEKRFRMLFETANDAIVLVRDNLFYDANTRSLELFGCPSKADLVGRSPADFSPPAQPDGRPSAAAGAALMAEAAAGKPQRFSWRHVRRDGTPFEAEVSLNAVETGDGILIEGIVRDMTERRRFEERLEKALREKETLLREVYHRTKNNMNVIGAMLSLRARFLDAPTAAVLREIEDRIRSMSLVHPKLY